MVIIPIEKVDQCCDRNEIYYLLKMREKNKINKYWKYRK